MSVFITDEEKEPVPLSPIVSPLVSPVSPKSMIPVILEPAPIDMRLSPVLKVILPIKVP